MTVFADPTIWIGLLTLTALELVLGIDNLIFISILAGKLPTNQRALGRRMGWGQFIRWLDPRVEKRHYHRHTGSWPSPARQPWLQWTDSMPERKTSAT